MEDEIESVFYYAKYDPIFQAVSRFTKQGISKGEFLPMCQLGHGDYRKLAQTSLKTLTKLFLGEADENMPDPQEFIH